LEKEARRFLNVIVEMDGTIYETGEESQPCTIDNICIESISRGTDAGNETIFGGDGEVPVEGTAVENEGFGDCCFIHDSEYEMMRETEEVQ
jgi:hypothetical protein